MREASLANAITLNGCAASTLSVRLESIVEGELEAHGVDDSEDGPVIKSRSCFGLDTMVSGACPGLMKTSHPLAMVLQWVGCVIGLDRRWTDDCGGDARQALVL
ncbi:hypothetical protein DAEQUDRAFT_165714 [Daedalea quercina L-15889]|uniref:Uncharacterized protein n=1 Tax=Daedalea quercina L-15889 TaxID=1314783 RepID=A0A165RHW8_9APHY|nr:hypothetical protein DAEQUDRAFT_165714 [Daedalea quercina L-15889]